MRIVSVWCSILLDSLYGVETSVAVPVMRPGL